MLGAHRIRLRFLSQEAMTYVTAGGLREAEPKCVGCLSVPSRPADARLQSASPAWERPVSWAEHLGKALKHPVVVVLASRSADASWICWQVPAHSAKTII